MRSRLRLSGLLVGLLALAYLGLAVTAVDYQPPGLGPILAGVMVVAGVIGLTVAWRSVRYASGRKPVIAAGGLLAAIAGAAMLFDLSQWLMLREGLDRARNSPGVSYAQPAPLLEVVLAPGLIIATAILAIGLAATGRPHQRVEGGDASVTSG